MTALPGSSICANSYCQRLAHTDATGALCALHHIACADWSALLSEGQTAAAEMVQVARDQLGREATA